MCYDKGMNDKTLITLEYNKIIDLLINEADSTPAKEVIRKLKPMTELSKIEQAQLETSDAVTRLFQKGSISFGSNRSMAYTVRSLELGSSLSVTELLHLAALLENVGRVKLYGTKEKDEEKDDSLTEDFEMLAPLFPLSSEIRHCILSEDEFADDASPELKSIRRKINATKEKIHSQLNQLLNGSLRTYLQEPVITMRGNRYCLPVRSEYKSQVPGMIHDQSSTGSTLFIEPQSVVNLNNDIRELELQEKEEIKRILATLSALAAEHTEEILYNQKILTKLDFAFAKGRLALNMNATRPVFRTEHIVSIKKARHPLLNKDTVVPIDIRLGDRYNLLIVTGPNTGGKTVSLKTMGLLTLMGQAGLHIPASDRSELSVFSQVYADIGDEQSIEQSLSTFSSHMTKIVQILKKADVNSLCLFDELGAGTDPTEGAALATAILDTLHKKNICTMATTHYSELKIYAMTTEGVENACCEFDVESLKPTYRLLIGIPGKSNAFAISSKLGLPSYIIELAKEHISTEEKSFEDLLQDLEKNRIHLEKTQLEVDEAKREIEKAQSKLKEQQEKLDAAKENIIQAANEEARDILKEAKDVADETIRVFQKAGPGASMKDLEKTRAEVRNKISDKNNALSIKANKATEKISEVVKKNIKLQKGDYVRIVSMGLKGTVNTLPDSKGNLFVQCGIMRTQANINDISLLEEEDSATKAKKSGPKLSPSGAGKLKMSKTSSISTEINLLGMTVDEAISTLDKYLDDAYLSKVPSVRIVHGKGTGALRSAVHQHLKRIRYVDSYRLGEYGEGDAGVTIATFK